MCGVGWGLCVCGCKPLFSRVLSEQRRGDSPFRLGESQGKTLISLFWPLSFYLSRTFLTIKTKLPRER